MEEFVKSIVQLVRDFDPYTFNDGFDSLEEVRDFGESEEIAKAVELLEKLEVLEDFAAL